ncbi:unnamed protein product [Adineta ricciae]|uniref:Apple domain-containing protein n=1 Tax=Adineta ricciae TaxID=249248 RepID=A0A815G903_ADIRI|nr:unnamed protein product [Adineta ricciae]CAF1336117.1 unnamed protein product [Adineta ricciae]
MNSSILAFALLAFMVISQSNARLIRQDFADDDFDQDLFEQKRDAPTHTRCTNIVKGQDSNGGDIGAINPGHVLSASACAALCETVAICDHWTFHVNDAECWLKDKPSQMQDSPNSYTGSCTKSE